MEMYETGLDAEKLKDVLWNLSNLSPPSPRSRLARASPPRPLSPSEFFDNGDEMLRSHAPSKLQPKNEPDKKVAKEESKLEEEEEDDSEDFLSSSQPTDATFNRSSMVQSFYEYSTLDNDASDHLLEDVAAAKEVKTPISTIREYVSTAKAPSRKEISDSLSDFGIPECKHQNVFCSKKSDVPEKGIDIGLFKLKLTWEQDVPEFVSTVASKTIKEYKKDFLEQVGLGQEDETTMGALFASSDKKIILESVKRAPTRKEIVEWIEAREILKAGSTNHDIDKNEVQPRDFDEEEAPDSNQSQVIVRVRRNSDDSLGSELSCSPPSSPPEPIQERSSASPTIGDCMSHSTPHPTHLRSRINVTDAAATPIVAVQKSDKRSLPRDSEGVPLVKKRRRISWRDEDSPSAAEDHDFVHSSQDAVSPEANATTSRLSSLRRNLLQSQFRLKFETPPRSLESRLQSEGDRSSGSPIEGVTPDNTHAFKMSFQNLYEAKALQEHQYLTVMSMELHATTRQKLNPDPEFDAIAAIFFVVTNDVPDSSNVCRKIESIFIVNPKLESDVRVGKARTFLEETAVLKDNIRYFLTEIELVHAFIQAVQDHDPDILVGYEVQMSSWGYLIERSARLGINLAPLISRLPSSERDSKMNEEEDRYGADHTSELRIAGRIVLNVWRLMRSEVAFYSYTFENMMFHVLHERIPKVEFHTLTAWWNHRTALYRYRVVDYYLIRSHGNLNLLEQLDLIGRTSEMARLFGIQFFEVISRGSQFRVESLMLRLAKRKNCVPVSPSIQQRAKSKAPEYIPLVMEPESRFYCDPVIVLDFQSLYPSIIMAYNYCYSTCLGRLQHFGDIKPYDFGCTQLKVSPKRLEKLLGHITFSPGGVAFLKSTVRPGVLPQMLKEILDTRLMVKKSMKMHKDDKTLQRILHARQLGLKLIANVTYGYTSANFSGRMPCTEVADSVVSKGRETLERAIKTIEKTAKWGAKVVYGDTDSVFVHLPGRSVEAAFKIGEEMEEAITQENPKPIKLKFEKVYYPCILQTKKRYVGFMYETRDQKEPVYDAKGIETVRRDGCPAVVKILEKSLRILFETKDVSKVKLFVQRQFQKIISGRASLQDLTFAKEFRGMGGYRPGAVVPAMELTKRFIRLDRRAVPRSGERVPYVVVYGEPGCLLIQAVRSPKEVLADVNLRPNAQYYIAKVIVPPLNRCFSLVGADVMAWFTELPKTFRPRLTALNRLHDEQRPSTSRQGKGFILSYFASHHCAVCDTLSKRPICDKCMKRPQNSAYKLTMKIHKWDKVVCDIRRICQSCTGFPEIDGDNCVSLDCPVLYKKKTASFDAEQIEYARQLLESISF